MASSEASNIQGYLRARPEDRRVAIAELRQVMLDNQPHGYQEKAQYVMIACVIALSRSSDTCNKQPLVVASLAPQKN
ncbi:MAG: hypothetical protein FJ314_02960 [SAR202 cluster bacterium]|nr:hypothetical protein [SAR202 cluster bacterium]